MGSELDKAAAMEAGQAGISSETNLYASTSCEKLKTTLSDHTDSTLVNSPIGETSCLPRWWKGSWGRLRSYMIGQWASRPQRERRMSSVRTLESCPQGYPNLAAFLDSDESFMVYRRFGFIQSRLLLEKQDELRELEEGLDRLDRREAKVNPKKPMTRDLPEDQLASRRRLFAVLETKFCAYANLVDAAQKMVSLNRPSRGDLASVQNYMHRQKPVMQVEDSWAEKEEDLITLRGGREHAWLDASIEKLLRWFHCSLLERVFGDERTRQKTSGIAVYYSHAQITRLANCIITSMVLILLVVPIYTLYHLINDVHTERAYAICMGVLCVSTLAFSAVLSLFTRAKRHEILAAAAAYCAVLVVFLGNVGINSNDGVPSVHL